MFVEDVIIHIQIEEQNKNRDKAKKAKKLSSQANMVEEKLRYKNNRFKKQNFRNIPDAINKVQNPTIRKGVITLL